MILIYLLFLLPFVSRYLPGGDSGEFVLNAVFGGIAHPPGYPFYSLSARAIAQIVPHGNVPWALGLFSAFCVAWAAAVIRAIFYASTKNRPLSLGLGLFFAFLPGIFETAIVAEVFALHHLLLVSLYWASFFREVPSSRKAVRLGSKIDSTEFGEWLIPIFFGLGIANHHLILLGVPAVVHWLFLGEEGQIVLRPTVARILRLMAGVTIGLSFYATLPWLSGGQHQPSAATGWGTLSSLNELVRHFLRLEYGSFSLASNGLGPLGPLLPRIGALTWHVITTCAVWLLAIGVLGGSLLFGTRWRPGKNDKAALMISIYGVVTLTIFVLRSNLNLAWPLYQTIWMRFLGGWWILVFVVLALLMSSMEKTAVWRVNQKSRRLLGLLVLALAGLQLGVTAAPLLRESKHGLLEAFATAVLEQLPPSSPTSRILLLSSGDQITHQIKYQQLVNNKRPDVLVVDYVYLTKQWSFEWAKRAFPELVLPGRVLGAAVPTNESGAPEVTPNLRQAYQLADLVEANRGRFTRIFLINGVRIPDGSLDRSSTLFPWGWSDEILASPDVGFSRAKVNPSDWDVFYRTDLVADHLGKQAWGSWEYDLYRLFVRQRFAFGSRLLKDGIEERKMEWVLSGVGHLEDLEARLKPGVPVPFSPVSVLYRNLSVGYQLLLPNYPQLKDAYERSRRMIAESESR